MSEPLSFGRMDVRVGVGPASAGGVPRTGTPFRVLLLGDWSGHPAQSAPRLVDRAPVLVDRDNFDEVLAGFGVEVPVPVTKDGNTRVSLRVGALDDFHPDQIVQRAEPFQALRALRARLKNPATFAAAAAEMHGWAPGNAAAGGAQPPSAPQAPPPNRAPVDPHNLLNQILGETPSQPAPIPDSAEPADWEAYVRKVVEPYLLPRVDYSQQSQLLALVDGVMSEQMRTILHAAEFQAAEAAWRGLFFLVRRLDTGTHLKLYLLDVSRDELAADLGSADDLGATQTCRLLLKRSTGVPGGEPWGVLVGHYAFDNSRQDVTFLGRMARIAFRAGAPFLAAASPRILGCDSLAETPDPDDWQPTNREGEEAWRALRDLPEADHLALALPRVLLRLPYGKQTDPVEQFPFEEMPEGSTHGNYLWGNPAVACAYLMAEAFSQSGWGFGPESLGEIDDLPAHVYREAGTSEMKPCAEAWLTDRGAEAIADKGLIPLLSVRGQGAVRLGRFQSLAGAGKPLARRW
jgi:type VI secretion system protein ImpC